MRRRLLQAALLSLLSASPGLADTAPLTEVAGSESDFPLLQACRDGNLARVKSLVKESLNIETVTGDGRTPLMLAVEGHPDVVQFLLTLKPDLNVQDDQGFTALAQAVAANDPVSAGELLDAGADANLADNTGRTPLLKAIEAKAATIVAVLVTHHADVNKGYVQGTPLTCAVTRDDLSDVKLLLDAGADASVPYVDRDPKAPTQTVLAAATLSNDHALLDLLLAHGCNVNGAGSSGVTPLLLALARANSYTVDYLIQKGADVNQPDSQFHTPLMAAAVYQKQPIWAELLAHGAKIDREDATGRTALMIAIELAKRAAAAFLIDHGANVNLVDVKGQTALSYAQDRGDTELIDILNEAGSMGDAYLIGKPMPHPPLPMSKRWEVAVGAIYDQVDGGNPNLLGGGRTPALSQKILWRDWKITGRDQLLYTIHLLLGPGRHMELQMKGDPTSPLAQVPTFSRSGRDLSVLIQQNYRTWKDRSGLAGDLVRAAHVISMGVSAGYLDEREAWPLLETTASIVQSQFSSWHEMSENFLDSREMWDGVADPQFETCAKLLCNPNDPNSPWNQIPWKTPLQTAQEAKLSGNSGDD